MQSRILLATVLILAVSIAAGAWWLQHDSVSEPRKDAPVQRSSTQAEAPDPKTLPTLDAPADEPPSRSTSRPDPPIPGTVDPERRVVVTGRFVDPRGEPVAGVRVLVAPAARAHGVPLETLDPARLPWSRRAETITDASGAFRFDDVPAGRSRLVARLGGHARYESLIVATDMRQDVGTIVLDDAVPIDGRVLDSARRPVAGATLRGLSPDAPPAVILSDAPGDVVATTDADGRFRVDELGRGPWMLLVKAAGHPERIEKGETPASGAAAALEIVLEDGARIAGRVVDAPPEALLDLWVTAVPKEQPSDGRVGAGEHVDEKRFLVVPRSVRCAPDGTFTVADLTANLVYRVAARQPGEDPIGRVATAWIDARAGERDVVLRWQAVTALVFQCVDAATGVPVTEMEVRVGRSFMLPLTDAKSVVRRAFPEGRVRFENLFQRPLEKGAELVIESRGHRERRIGDLRPIAGRDLDLGVLKLEPAPLVRVRVVDAATQQPIAGAQVALTLVASAARDARPRKLSFAQEGLTDADGSVQLNSLAGETAEIRVTHTAYAPFRSPPIALASTGDRDETITLTRGGTVVVRVHDALGAVARDVRVVQEHYAHDGWEGDPRLERAPATDAKGDVRFERLPAGRHRFSTVTNRGIAATPGSVAEAVVTEGGEHVVELVVPQRVRVTGRVTDGGEPLEGAIVRFTLDTGGEFSGSCVTRTSGDGEYVLDDAEPGLNRVNIVHPARAMPFECETRIASSTTRFDVSLPRAAIEGRVLALDGTPLQGFVVHIGPASGDPGPAQNGQCVSDAGGKFVFQGVRPDTPVVLSVSGGEYQPARSGVITVAAGEVRAGVELRLAAGAALDVTVRRNDGRSAADCRVRATFAGEDAAGTEAVTATVNAAGSARFQGLRPGRWRLRAEASGDAASSGEIEVDVRAGAANTAALELR